MKPDKPALFDSLAVHFLNQRVRLLADCFAGQALDTASKQHQKRGTGGASKRRVPNKPRRGRLGPSWLLWDHCTPAVVRDKLPAGEHMATSAKRLLGNGKLSDSDGRNFNADVRYELTVTSRDVPPPYLADPSAVVRRSTNDTVNGRVTMLSGQYRSAGELMTLTLEDGKKLKVIMGFSGEVTGSGDFY